MISLGRCDMVIWDVCGMPRSLLTPFTHCSYSQNCDTIRGLRCLVSHKVTELDLWLRTPVGYCVDRVAPNSLTTVWINLPLIALLLYGQTYPQ